MIDLLTLILFCNKCFIPIYHELIFNMTENIGL